MSLIAINSNNKRRLDSQHLDYQVGNQRLVIFKKTDSYYSKQIYIFAEIFAEIFFMVDS
jgi:hypothetical protein